MMFFSFYNFTKNSLSNFALRILINKIFKICIIFIIMSIYVGEYEVDAQAFKKCKHD